MKWLFLLWMATAPNQMRGLVVEMTYEQCVASMDKASAAYARATWNRKAGRPQMTWACVPAPTARPAVPA